jgi:hypothetical protein
MSSSTLPSPITTMKLLVSTGTSPNVQTFEQDITSASPGSNTVAITTPELLTAFNNALPGTIFSSSIVATYSGFPSGNTIAMNSVLNFVPRKIQTVITIQPIPEDITGQIDLDNYVSSNSPAPLSYASSNPNIATVDSNGILHFTGVEGDVDLIITEPASADGVYSVGFLMERIPPRWRFR